MQFRNDINGLRAIAVIAVVLFHFNPSWLPGGFAGVDVFFVISGFLMTGIIFKGIEQENFSILKFYIARANRIIPALAALCLVMLLFGWLYLTPLDYEALGKHVASSILFISNIIYWKESGYFDAASHGKWLLHTWSLSVEWQFYIIYPLILVAMRKFMSINLMKKVLLFSTILGFVLCIIITYMWPSPAYYLLPARAWEMMIGGVAFLYPMKLKEERKKHLEWLGLILIFASYFLISEDSPWPGYLSFFPVLGAFLIIQAQRNNSLITNNVFSQKIGAWSYSIYLWHWPFVVAIYSLSLDEYFIYLGISLSLLLGFISNKYIEKIRFKNNFTNLCDYLKCKPILMALFITIMGLGVFSSGGINTPFRSATTTPQAKFLDFYTQASTEESRYDSYWLKCNTYASLNNTGTLTTDPICVTPQSTKGGVFLWGDSHAESLSLGIRSLLTPMGVPFYQKTSAGCHASLIQTTMKIAMFKKSCDHSNQVAIESIAKLKPKLVIIAQAHGHDKNHWEAIISRLKSIGVESILLVGPVSQWAPSLPKVIIKPRNWNNNDLFINDPGLDISIIELESNIKHILPLSGMKYISLIDQLCLVRDGKYFCKVKLESGELLQVDYGHLSDEGSIFVVNEILADEVKKLLAD